MDLRLSLERRAGFLVNALGNRGIVSTLGEAIRALRRYGNQYGRAAQFIERNARRNQRGDIQTRLQQRIGSVDNVMDIDTPANMARRRFAGPSGPPFKRLHLGNAAPAGVQQKTYHKRYYKGVKPRSINNRVVRQLKASQCDQICRWQSLISPQPTAASLLSLKLSNYKAASGIFVTSCYAFNLSSLGRQPNQNWKVVPLYRLQKDLNVTGAVQAWSWAVWNGIKNAADGTTTTYPWQLEHYEGGFDSVSSEYRHDWSDVKIMLQGTTKYPVRYHIYRVQFMADGLGPDRYYYDAADNLTQFDDSISDSTDFNENDYFWERFMEPKVVHPFANTKKTGLTGRRHFKVITHEVINLGSEVTISNDVQPLQHIHSMFVKSGKYFTNTNAVQTERDLMPEGAAPNDKCGIKGDGKVGFSNTNDVTANAPFGVDRSKDEWLMIVAENYTQVGDGYEPAVSESVDTTPSFDIRVRQKCTVFKK